MPVHKISSHLIWREITKETLIFIASVYAKDFVWKPVIKEFVKNISCEQNRQVFRPPFGEIFSLFSSGRNSSKFRKVFVEML